MALFDSEGRNLLFGVALGVGATLFLRDILPGFKGAGRPLAKAALRSGMTTFDKARESLARLGEDWEDLVAEVRSELEDQTQQQAAEGLAPHESVGSGTPVNGGGNAS
jgi:hypothetical protein